MWAAIAETVGGGRKGERVEVIRVVVRVGSAAWEWARRVDRWLYFWLGRRLSAAASWKEGEGTDSVCGGGSQGVM